MKTVITRLRCVDTNVVVVPCLETADTLWKRTIGLIGRDDIATDTGMWIKPCNSIHTFGVRFPIDALFLDAQGVVVYAASHLRPCRTCGPFWKSKSVVELAAGTLARYSIKPGMQFTIEPAATKL